MQAFLASAKRDTKERTYQAASPAKRKLMEEEGFTPRAAQPTKRVVVEEVREVIKRNTKDGN